MNASEIPVTTALSSVDIANMKSANSVGFFHQGDGTTLLRLHSKSEISESHEDEVRVPSIVYGGTGSYGGHADYSVDDIVDARFAIVTAEFDDAWRTIIHLLNEGDRFEVYWHMGSNTSLLLEKHGLVGDSIEIVIKRDLPEGSTIYNNTMKFLLDVRITEKDSSARMFKFSK